jgi:para-aminobenzoate synthetase/4-amino-4-deoxychorismate lyase
MAYVLLENRKTMIESASAHYFYGEYARIHCYQPEAVRDCLKNVEEARRLGKYIVGYIAYEAAYGLNKKIFPTYHNSSHRPLIDFYIFENHEILMQPQVDSLLREKISKNCSKETFIHHLALSFDLDSYSASLEKLKGYIKNGDTYQVNFTGKYTFQLQGCPIQLYQALRERQKVAFSALFHSEETKLLSFSPELFFEKKGENFCSKPMKGTMPRSNNHILDAKNRDQLTSNPKTIAENMIIVDLIRNDLSIIAKPKSVHVPRLLEVEQYETVYQMTSTVQCKVEPEICFSDIIGSLFPCGSITGAPKIKTMQIIRALEKKDRGIYTGAIGYITPQNDMCFNVAIRTLHLDEDQNGEMGVGGGITYDSHPEDEFEEAKLKAKFLTGLAVPFDLIECFLYEVGVGFRYLDDHLARLQKSAQIFNFTFSKKAIVKKLIEIENTMDTACKVKIVLQKNGHFNISSTQFDAQSVKRKIKICSEKIKTENNILLRHKTTAQSVRGFYDASFARENTDTELFDIVFVNEQGFITEGSKSNVFISKQGNILTPPLACGILPGIMRKKYMTEYPQTKEAYITKEDLIAADTIWMTNSVVGIIQVDL